VRSSALQCVAVYYSVAVYHYSALQRRGTRKRPLASLLWGSFAKETYVFREPATQKHTQYTTGLYLRAYSHGSGVYWVAIISRLIKNIGLFGRISSL